MADRLKTEMNGFLRLGLLMASIGFMLFVLGASPMQQGEDPRGWGIQRWTEWRDDQIRRILTPTFPASGGKIVSREEVILRCVDTAKFLAPLLNEPDFLADAGRKRALGNFVRFVRGQSTMSIYDESGRYNHALGFDISDVDYFRRASSRLQFPSLLASQKFLQALSAPATYKRAADMIDAENGGLAPGRRWTVLAYRSRFLKSADTLTYGRFLVFVPGEPDEKGATVDRWIQFAIAVPDGEGGHKPDGTNLRSVSMVAVQRDASGKEPPQAYLADFMRDRSEATGSISIVPTMLEKKNPSKNCYDCHKSPVLPIHPKAIFAFDDHGDLTEEGLNAGKTVEELDSTIAGYGACEFTMMDAPAFGPSIGPVGRERSDRFIRESAGDPSLAPDSIDRIRSAMNCTSCHEGASKLNYPQAVNSNIGFSVFEQKIGLVQTFIESGWMPPNNTLSPAERKALWKCLDKEYLDSAHGEGVLVDWLRGAPGGAE